MKKKITVKVNSTYKYLQLWNGIFNLTNTELVILAAFIDVDNVIDEQNTNFCSMQNKKAVAAGSGIKDPNTLNNYIKKFKDKGVMLKNMNIYKINPFLNPQTDSVEVTIRR